MIADVIEGSRKDLGGFEVARILPQARRRTVGPFVFLDHMGPAAFQPGMGLDVRPHPHIGLSTLTYLFDGEFVHRDSLGFTQPIRPGEVNWMTAGRGIVHSERTGPDVRAAGGAMHGLQAWIGLPAEDEETEPAFDHYEASDLPTYEHEGVWARLIAGTAFGVSSPVRTFSPLFYLHWELRPGARAAPPDGHAERAIYVARGAVEVEGRTFGPGRMVVFANDDRPTITALETSTVACLGGASIGAPHVWWNLVSHSRERIEQAKADWARGDWGSGRFTLPPDDDQEFIPLPDAPKPPERMS